MGGSEKKLKNKAYNKELKRLQQELAHLQKYVQLNGLKVIVLFEGRDAAGKGGTIKRIMQHLNPRSARVVALGKPSERELTEWYFKRYVAHLPCAGEIVIFDRSWYNRAGVEKVMGFATADQVELFFKQCPAFEKMLIDSGHMLIKYWFSVSDEEQEKRFQARMQDITTAWKLSPMDLEARTRWIDYSKAKDDMFARTHSAESPWFVVESDDKKKARLNCITHLLTQVPYKHVDPPVERELPPRQQGVYERPPKGTNEIMVPEKF